MALGQRNIIVLKFIIVVLFACGYGCNTQRRTVEYNTTFISQDLIKVQYGDSVKAKRYADSVKLRLEIEATTQKQIIDKSIKRR